MKKILSIFLSLLLLFSSMGFTLSTHFCGGHAMESTFNVGKDHLDCGMMDNKKACTDHSSDRPQVNNSECCSNEFTTYNIQDDFSTKASISLNHSFIVALVYTYLSIPLIESEANNSHLCYNSPPLLQDIPVLNQSFLL